MFEDRACIAKIRAAILWLTRDIMNPASGQIKSLLAAIQINQELYAYKRYRNLIVSIASPSTQEKSVRAGYMFARDKDTNVEH